MALKVKWQKEPSLATMILDFGLIHLINLSFTPIFDLETKEMN